MMALPLEALPCALPAPSCTVPASAMRCGAALQLEQEVLEEVPVALVYNGIAHAVMLATPLDLEDFALGFSLGEGIVEHAGQVYDLELRASERGVEAHLQIAAGAMARLKLARRSRAGQTGCGLCGMESLDQFGQIGAPLPVPVHARARTQVLRVAMDALAARQPLHRATGAAHAAGWAGWDGRLALVREDVGRHNALDKLVGAMARSGVDPAGGFALVTSRASYELVQKCARARIELLAAISAPTALAVRTADRAGVTLAGYVRAGSHTLYSHPQRLA